MSNASPTTIVEHVPCLACGCLCDDIRIEVRDDRVIETGKACPIGRSWFLAPHPGEDQPAASIEGRSVSLEEAIRSAAEILRAARAPFIRGLAGSTIEAVASALAIADRIGAVVDIAGTPGSAARLAAFQRVGLVSATLGEIKDRADLVIFWGADPLATHPRHWERYSVEPRGRFIPDGRKGRFVIVVDSEPTKSSQAADLFIRVESIHQAETLEALRALVRKIEVAPDRVERATGLDFVSLKTLAARFLSARYGAFFFGPSLDRVDSCTAAFALVRDLNDGRRFVGLDLGSPGNPAGAEAVLSWQAGVSQAVDYGLGYPRHLPGEATWLDRSARGEIDAALIVSEDPMPHQDPFPSIVLAPGATRKREQTPTVAINVARPGIEAGGTVARVDGLMLPLRPAMASILPTDREILEAIDREIMFQG